MTNIMVKNHREDKAWDPMVMTNEICIDNF